MNYVAIVSRARGFNVSDFFQFVFCFCFSLLVELLLTFILYGRSVHTRCLSFEWHTCSGSFPSHYNYDYYYYLIPFYFSKFSMRYAINYCLEYAAINNVRLVFSFTCFAFSLDVRNGKRVIDAHRKPEWMDGWEDRANSRWKKWNATKRICRLIWRRP